MAELQAGYARTDITPPLTIPYLGFVPRQAYFEGIHDPLYARALALETDDCAALVIVADAIGFDDRILGEGRHFTSEVRSRVADRTGVPAAQVMLACTHAHSTPETIHFRRLLDHPGAACWLDTLLDQLASAAAMAWRARRPRELRVGSIEVSGLSHPRRAPLRARALGISEAQAVADYPLDRRARVLLLTDAERDSHIVVAHYACHPVTVQVQPLVSADFPGVALQLVTEAIPGCEGALFLQGCDGDVNPPQVTTRFADVMRYGLMLGGAVLEAVGALLDRDLPPSEPVLRVTRELLHLPSREVPSPEELGEEPSDPGERRMWEEQRVRVSWGRGPVPVEVQALRLGEAAIVGVGGEPFMALNLALQEESPAATTLVVGYANGYAGYLAPPEAWAEGGYEVGLGPWSQVGPQGWEPLVAAGKRLLGSLWP